MVIRDFFWNGTWFEMEEWKKYWDHFGLIGNGKENSDNFITIFEFPGTMKDHSCKTARSLEFSWTSSIKS